MDLRNYTQTKFSEYLSNNNAKKLEISVFNFAIKYATSKSIPRSWANKSFKTFYKSKALSLIYNLTHNNSFSSKIENKLFKLEIIPYMKSWEIWPEKYEDYFQKKLAKEMIQLQQREECENMTGMFTCKKCKSDCTSVFSIQTRSADEPMTNYITCKKCDYRWKD